MEYFGIEYFINSSQRVYWLYILSALVIAIIYIKFNPHAKKYFSKDVLWHPSARLDYQYFIAVSFVKMVLIFPFILSSKDVSLNVVLFLQDKLGYINQFDFERGMVLVLYTLSIFLVNDFTRYWLHRFLHEIPLLWKFHRLHHSAEVLNPLTFYRVHPVENVLFGLRYALSVGATTGVFIYLFGAKIGVIEVLGANVFTFVFGMLGSNLRHSHIPLRFGIFEKVLISPFMHQLHHASHSMNKNYGGVLALWDLIFRTWHVENSSCHLKLGADIKHQNLLEAFWEPVKSSLQFITRSTNEKSFA